MIASWNQTHAMAFLPSTQLYHCCFNIPGIGVMLTFFVHQDNIWQTTSGRHCRSSSVFNMGKIYDFNTENSQPCKHVRTVYGNIFLACEAGGLITLISTMVTTLLLKLGLHWSYVWTRRSQTIVDSAKYRVNQSLSTIGEFTENHHCNPSPTLPLQV